MKKTIFISIATFLLGAGAGFLVTKLVLEKKYAELAEEEIASVKEMYERRLIKEVEKENNTVRIVSTAAIPQSEDAKITNPSGVLVRPVIDNQYENAKRNYNLIKQTPVESIVDEPDEDDEDDEDCDDGEVRDDAGHTQEEMDALNHIDRTQPYLIDDVSFAEEFDHHDKISLYYYRVDDVLCEENEEEIKDIENTVGYDALNLLDMRTTAWVRNERLRIDYEIISFNKSYAETVAGFPQNRVMTPREKYDMRQKKQKRGEENGD